MRVLALSHSAVAGPYRDKWRLLSRRRGWELTLAIPCRWPEGGAMLEATSAPAGRLRQEVLEIRLPGRLGFFTYKGLDRLVAELKPDLLYAEEEPYSLAAFQAARAAKRHGAAFAFFSWENMRRRYKPPLNWVRRRVLGLSSGAVAGNREGMAILRGLGFRGALNLIPQYGVDAALFKPAARAGRGFKAGFVGRLASEKGADLFIRACAKADLAGVIYGQGPDETALRALASALGARIEFRGFRPFESRHLIYREFDLLVLPSRTGRIWKEQFGRVIIEAAACGLPCLGSDSGAIPEVVGEGGLITPEGDLDALAEALKSMALKPALRKALGKKARARALAEYGEAALSRRLAAFLESLA